MLVQVEETEKGLTLTIPKELVSGSYATDGATVDVTWIDDKVLLAPVRRSKYTTEELLAGVTDDNIHPETDWGPPVGKEVW